MAKISTRIYRLYPSESQYGVFWCASAHAVECSSLTPSQYIEQSACWSDKWIVRMWAPKDWLLIRFPLDLQHASTVGVVVEWHNVEGKVWWELLLPSEEMIDDPRD